MTSTQDNFPITKMLEKRKKFIEIKNSGVDDIEINVGLDSRVDELETIIKQVRTLELQSQ